MKKRDLPQMENEFVFESLDLEEETREEIDAVGLEIELAVGLEFETGGVVRDAVEEIVVQVLNLGDSILESFGVDESPNGAGRAVIELGSVVDGPVEGVGAPATWGWWVATSIGDNSIWDLLYSDVRSSVIFSKEVICYFLDEFSVLGKLQIWTQFVRGLWKLCEEYECDEGFNIKEWRDHDPAAARAKRLKEAREQLVDLRDKLTDLLKQDWKQFSISDYVSHLNSYPFKRDEIWSDVSVDLNILKELRDKLEYKSAEAEKNHYKEQYTFLHAIQKRAMMLCKLDLALQNHHRTITPDMIRCFRQILEGVYLKYMLEFADRKEEVLSKGRAKKYGEEVQIPEFKGDEIEFDNPKLVIDQFKGYEEKVNEASSEIKIGDNLHIYIDSLRVLESVKCVLLQLERMCLLKPDDDIKVVEECQEIHRSIQPDR
ncbi:uncharacterized protein LOC113311626 [Papaver somniferum]|uniref:uncharacterized protein LOC113311626 n=1 Tax=Papaver somniferum TaxID=3469 RepID=UPI000E6F8419|nr:uncharacterized protein LOC113311626 [Papaver somniferum]